MNKIIGIIGGMGPMATADLMKKIYEYSSAATDQDNVRIIADSNTNIPDRTAAILHGGEDPVPQMLASAKGLEAMGADVLVISCNTAHYFYDRLTAEVNVPILHMPRETVMALADRGVTKAAILATDGTIRTGVYQSALAEYGIEAILPCDEDQATIMSLIYDCVKAGASNYGDYGIGDIVARLKAAGAETVIMGCTELPIVFDALGISNEGIDATAVLATRALEMAGYTVSRPAY